MTKPEDTFAPKSPKKWWSRNQTIAFWVIIALIVGGAVRSCTNDDDGNTDPAISTSTTVTSTTASPATAP